MYLYVKTIHFNLHARIKKFSPGMRESEAFFLGFLLGILSSLNFPGGGGIEFIIWIKKINAMWNPQIMKKNKSKMKTTVLKNHQTVHLRKILRMLCIEIGTTPNGLIISGTIGVKTSNSLCFKFWFCFSVLSIFARCTWLTVKRVLLKPYLHRFR